MHRGRGVYNQMQYIIKVYDREDREEPAYSIKRDQRELKWTVDSNNHEKPAPIKGGQRVLKW
jgi:hypothetical protein